LAGVRAEGASASGGGSVPAVAGHRGGAPLEEAEGGLIMDLKMKSLCTLGVAIALLAGGCGGEGGAAGGGSAAPAAGSDDHEHAEEGHEGHEGHDHGPGEHDEHEADLRSLGTVEVGGSTLAVSIGGDLQPGAELH